MGRLWETAKACAPCECESTLMVGRRVGGDCVNSSVFDLGAPCLCW